MHPGKILMIPNELVFTSQLLGCSYTDSNKEGELLIIWIIKINVYANF